MRNSRGAGAKTALARLGLAKSAFDGHDTLPGGKADHMKPSDFSRKQLAAGATHETEHVRSKAIAREIASDHLAEDPRYYQKIKKIES